MDLGKQSYPADLPEGFDLLHTDPTKDPHIKGVVPMETVLNRTVELTEYVEGERAARNLPPVAYEVGTEETSGGQTRAYLLLASIEQNAYDRGMLETRSDFVRVIQKAAVESQRWRKWMVGNTGLLPVEAVMDDECLVRLITETAGHYTFENKEVRQQMKIMFGNLDSIGLEPYNIVIDRIKKSIARYVECFNLTGLTAKIVNILEIEEAV